MRSLSAPPSSVIDPSSRAVNAGSFEGSLPPVDLSPLGRGRLFRLAHHKRWIYAAVATDELFLAIAIIDLGYVASAFAFALHRETGKLLFDHTALGPPFAGSVGDRSGEGCSARFDWGGTIASFVREAGEGAYRLLVKAPDVRVEARLLAAERPPGIAAIARLGDGLVNATEKRALLPATGEAVLKGRRFSLDGALGGFDYTHGYLARHTAWRWAFGLGRARGGEKIGFNLVEGFVGEPECAVWIDDAVYPLPEGRFAFDPADPMASWRITAGSGAVDLHFQPMGLHAEHKNLGIVRSRFVQPSGVFRGRIAPVGHAPVEIDGVLGVTEDQDVVW